MCPCSASSTIGSPCTPLSFTANKAQRRLSQFRMVLFASPEFPFCLSSTLEEASTRYSLAQNKSMSLFPSEQLYPWSWFTPNFTHDLVGHGSPCTRCGGIEQMAWGRGGRHTACRLIPALPMCLVWFTHICKKNF